MTKKVYWTDAVGTGLYAKTPEELEEYISRTKAAIWGKIISGGVAGGVYASAIMAAKNGTFSHFMYLNGIAYGSEQMGGWLPPGIDISGADGHSNLLAAQNRERHRKLFLKKVLPSDPNIKGLQKLKFSCE